MTPTLWCPTGQSGNANRLWGDAQTEIQTEIQAEIQAEIQTETMEANGERWLRMHSDCVLLNRVNGRKSEVVLLSRIYCELPKNKGNRHQDHQNFWFRSTGHVHWMGSSEWVTDEFHWITSTEWVLPNKFHWMSWMVFSENFSPNNIHWIYIQQSRRQFIAFAREFYPLGSRPSEPFKSSCLIWAIRKFEHTHCAMSLEALSIEGFLLEAFYWRLSTGGFLLESLPEGF